MHFWDSHVLANVATTRILDVDKALAVNSFTSGYFNRAGQLHRKPAKCG